jgi:hypothetical protein
MRYFELFNGNFAFFQSAANLRFIGALKPQFDRFLDHFFSVFNRFSLANDAEFGAVRHIQSIFPGLNHSGKFWKLHHEQITSFHGTLRPGSDLKISQLPDSSNSQNLRNPRSQHLSKLSFVDDSYAEFFCLIELAPRLCAGEDVVGLLAHAPGDVAAERFDLFRRFLARQ